MAQCKRIDITGQRFGKVTVLRFSHTTTNAYWLCRCDCGKEFTTLGNSLRRGLTKSCGCYREEAAKNTHQTHGDTDTRFYKIWCGIKVRTNNRNTAAYSRYGGRGITLCDRWTDYENFKEDMYPAYQEHCRKHGEKNTTIDRRETNAGYSQNNCRWATYKEQNNNRRDNVAVSERGLCCERV